MEIQVNGQPLTGSPWVVQVPHQDQFAFYVLSTGKHVEYYWPIDIAVREKTGTIAVTDRDNERIEMFSSDGSFLREIALNNEPFSFILLRLVTSLSVPLTMITSFLCLLRVVSSSGTSIIHTLRNLFTYLLEVMVV